MSALVVRFVDRSGRVVEFQRSWEAIDGITADAMCGPDRPEGAQRLVTELLLDWLRRQNLQPTDMGARILREYLTAAVAGGDSDRLPPEVPVEPLRDNGRSGGDSRREARIARATAEIMAGGGVVFATDSVVTAAEELSAAIAREGWRPLIWTSARAFGPDAATVFPTLPAIQAPEHGRDTVHPEAPELLERSLRALLDAPGEPERVVLLLCDPPFERMRDGGAGALFGELAARARLPGLRAAILASRDIVPPEIRADWKISRLRVVSATPILDTYGVDLCQLARENPMPAFGVDRTIERIVTTLLAAEGLPCSPVVIGPPGGGKTAVVQELARRLVSNPSDPIVARLRTRDGELPGLIGLSVSRMQQGAVQSGGIGPFINELVDELRETTYIVFVDEVHQIAAGSGVGEALKEGLGRGLRLIGATTSDEWAYIEKDRALYRRLDPIFLAEVGRDEMVRQMSSVWLPRFLREKKVRIPDDVLRRGAELADAYFGAMSRPARLIYLLDRATTRAQRETETELTEADLQGVLRDRLGIGVDAETRAETLKQLRERLASELVGQTDAVEAIVEVAELYLADADRRKLPLVVRASGLATAGTARAAEILHEVLFPGPPLTSFDFSMYTQPHSVEAITGAPAGYVMSDQGSMLARRVKEANGRLVILIDKWYEGASAVRALFRGFFQSGILRPRDGSLPASFLQAIFWITDDPSATSPSHDPASLFEALSNGSRDVAAASANDRELASLVGFEISFTRLSDDDLRMLATRTLDDLLSHCRSSGMTVIADGSAAEGLVESARSSNPNADIGRSHIDRAAERLWISINHEARRQAGPRPAIGLTWHQGWRLVERSGAVTEGQGVR